MVTLLHLIVSVINMPDLILRHSLPIKFVEVSMYGKIIKAEYGIHCKMAKLIHFIHSEVYLCGKKTMQ